MSTTQEYWDACLIRTWRQHGSFLDAVNMFKSITGIDLITEEGRRPVIRTPRKYFPIHTGIRIFVAQYLPKISERLFDQPPEKDVMLLRRLATSKYDCEEKAYTTSNETEQKRVKSQLARNRLKVGISTQHANNRNHNTDWNVTKGPAKIRRKR